MGAVICQCSQNSSKLEASQEIKIDTSKEAKIIKDDLEKSELSESNVPIMRLPQQNSLTHTGRYSNIFFLLMF